MPRRPRPWYRTDRDGWYTQMGGRQYRLATGIESEGMARLALSRLLEERTSPSDPLETLDASGLPRDARTVVYSSSGIMVVSPTRWTGKAPVRVVITTDEMRPEFRAVAVTVVARRRGRPKRRV